VKVIRHKVEALNPALWKKLGTQRGVGASGATGYLLCPLDIGRKGLRVVGIRFLAPTGSYMKHVS
jgi:hypothetical protein